MDMTLEEAILTVRYVVDSNGEKTEVLIPVETWKKLLATWEQLIQQLEDQEDSAIVKAWLEERAGGKAAMISLEELEEELRADGLLPS